MEWRAIPVCPESRTGQIRIPKRIPILGFTTSVQIVPAYTREDVWDFFSRQRKIAIHNEYLRKYYRDFFRGFDDMNSAFLSALERTRWPIEDVSILGPMYIPISDEQLQFEQIEPFLEFGHFKTLPFELQLLVLKFVDFDPLKRNELLAEISSERQAELLYAILDPTD